MVSSNESESPGQHDTSEEEVESSDQNELVPAKKVWKPRKPRTATKWPIDKMTVTEVEADGMPKERKAKRRMRRLAGLIARHHIAISVGEFKSIDKDDKQEMFNNYIQPYLEFPKAMKELDCHEVPVPSTTTW